MDAWAERERGSRPGPGSAGGYRNAFRLARGLRAAGVTVFAAVYSSAGEGACRRAGVSPDDLFGLLLPAWERVRTLPADDALSRAARLADLDAGRFLVPDAPPLFARLLALAFHLTGGDPGRWAAFGSERIGGLLGVHRNTVDTAVNELERLGRLAVARDADGRTLFSRKKRQARQIRFLAPQPAG